MDKRSGVIAGGNWIVDYLKIIDVYPAQDSLANIKKEFMNNGGSPYNVLKDLSRLGATFPLKAVGLVGDDDNGAWIKKDCQRHGIDATALVATIEAPTSYTDVMSVESTGRRTFFHQRGANAFLDVRHFDFQSSKGKIFHLGYLLLLDALDEIHEGGLTGAARVLRQARQAGLKTAVDLVSEDSERFQRLVFPSLPFVDYLFLNEFEAEKCTGVALSGEHPDAEALEQAAAALFARGVREWVIIHFPGGVFARQKSGVVLRQSALKIPDEKIASAVGAGDALLAGTLFGIHEEWNMQDSLKLGVCAAAASLFDASCSGGVLPWQECLTLQELYP